MAGDQENPDGTARYFGLYTGTVVARDDPRKLGRVRIRIPGLVDTQSAWAWPLAQPGAGGPRLGFKIVPKLNADVGVLFLQGDVDHPYYFAGNWGAPTDDDLEVPGGGKSVPVEDVIDAVGEALTPEEAPDVHVLETDSWIVAFDERPSVEGRTQGSLFFRHKRTGDHIEYDATLQGWLIRASATVDIRAKGVVNIEGAQVQINGRVVRNGLDPI